MSHPVVVQGGWVGLVIPGLKPGVGMLHPFRVRGVGFGCDGIYPRVKPGVEM